MMGMGPNEIELALPFRLASCSVGAPEQPVSTQTTISITIKRIAVVSPSMLRCIIIVYSLSSINAMVNTEPPKFYRGRFAVLWLIVADAFGLEPRLPNHWCPSTCWY